MHVCVYMKYCEIHACTCMYMFMYMCIHVCISMCVHVYTWNSVNTCMYMFMYNGMYLCVMYACMYVRMYTYVCMYASKARGSCLMAV